MGCRTVSGVVCHVPPQPVPSGNRFFSSQHDPAFLCARTRRRAPPADPPITFPLSSYWIWCYTDHHLIYTRAHARRLRLRMAPSPQGLRWMRAREHARDARPHPEFVPIDAVVPTNDTTATADSNAPALDDDQLERGREPASGDEPGAKHDPLATSTSLHSSERLWMNVVDGMVWPSAPGPCLEVRGGLLCDEPGLGKTITVLALLLRTRGLLPGELTHRAPLLPIQWLGRTKPAWLVAEGFLRRNRSATTDRLLGAVLFFQLCCVCCGACLDLFPS